MLFVQLAVAFMLALGGDVIPVAGTLVNPVNLGEEQVEYQRPPKEREPHPLTWGELKSMYN